MLKDSIFGGTINRLLQIVARVAPGAQTWRVRLHRWRGVNIGEQVWVGYDAILETGFPQLITLKDRCTIGVGVIIIAHMHGTRGVVIEEDVTIGPGAVILPSVTVGKGSIVTAGSVVTRSVPPMTMVQGNPAKPVARLGKMLLPGVTMKEFSKHLRPISSP